MILEDFARGVEAAIVLENLRLEQDAVFTQGNSPAHTLDGFRCSTLSCREQSCVEQPCIWVGLIQLQRLLDGFQGYGNLAEQHQFGGSLDPARGRGRLIAERINFPASLVSATRKVRDAGFVSGFRALDTQCLEASAITDDSFDICTR